MMKNAECVTNRSYVGKQENKKHVGAGLLVKEFVMFYSWRN